MTPEAEAPREAITRAAETLAKQADRFMRAAHSLTRTALRLATIDHPSKVLQALAIYQQSNLPEPDRRSGATQERSGTRPMTATGWSGT